MMTDGDGTFNLAGALIILAAVIAALLIFGV